MDRCFIGLSKLVNGVDDTIERIYRTDIDEEDKLSIMPRDLQIEIIKQLPMIDVVQLCSTNRYWYSLLDKDMWEYFYHRDFNRKCKHIHNTWYNNYLYYFEMTKYCKYINESCENSDDSAFSSWDVLDIDSNKDYCYLWSYTQEICSSCKKKIHKVRKFNEKVLKVVTIDYFFMFPNE